MARKRGNVDNFLSRESVQTPAQAAQKLFGGSETTQYINAEPISLSAIQPDAMQPRRAIPVRLRNSARSVIGLLEAWLEVVTEEYGLNIDARKHIEAEQTARSDNNEDDETLEFAPIVQELYKLLDLAASIKRDGLTNPISVVIDDTVYRIETGERRWLAYHLLNALYPDSGFQAIPARVMEQFSVWRQAAENNARNDLNAVGKARQLSLLLMDLHGPNNFSALDNFNHEREFYAQVGDGNQWRIPRGKGELVLNAMGFTDMGQIRKYRQILNVSNEIWDKADEENLPYYVILEKPTVPIGTVSSPTPSDEITLFDRGKYFKSPSAMHKLFDRVGRGDQKAYDKLVTQITYQREWLDELENELNNLKTNNQSNTD